MGHCTRALHIETESDSVRCDDSIVLDQELNFYKVVETSRTEVKLSRIKTDTWISRHEPDLPFYKVGVQKYQSLDTAVITRKRDWVKGKGVHLPDGLLVPFYWDMLFS